MKSPRYPIPITDDRVKRRYDDWRGMKPTVPGRFAPNPFPPQDVSPLVVSPLDVSPLLDVSPPGSFAPRFSGGGVGEGGGED